MMLLLGGCRTELVEVAECRPDDEFHFLCGVRNPEDVQPLPDGRWWLASTIRRPGDPPGAIVAFTLDGDHLVTLAGPDAPVAQSTDPIFEANREICPGPLDTGVLEPHGLALMDADRPTWALLVVNHGGRESVEIYTLEPGDGPPRIAWAGCVPLPPGLAGNDVIGLPDGGIAVTASSSPRSRVAQAKTLVKLALRLTGGEVIEWDHDAGWRPVAGTKAVLPNGLAVSADSRWLFVSDWAAQRIIRVDRTADGAPASVDVPHHPDNLSWTVSGRLLSTGQIGSIPTTLECFDPTRDHCGQAWSVGTIDPERLDFHVVAEDDGRAGGAASSAVLAGDTLVIGQWVGDRIARLRITDAR